MGWLSKLLVVDNLGCPKYKRNSAEFFVEKKIPQLREYLGILFCIDQVV
jgi:hypothetical protein